MSQNSQKRKIESTPESIVSIKMPLVRDYSTSGGHLPGDQVVDGDEVTRKWQGYAPENLNVVGKSLPALPEVSIPRFTGKAEYATRIWFPDMLQAKFLTCPHPRARIRSIDTSKAEAMPGVRFILTHLNAPPPHARGGPASLPPPFPEQIEIPDEVVAIIAADTEDQAEDAAEAIEIDYEVLPFASTLEQAMSRGAPDLRGGGNLILQNENSPTYSPDATWANEEGEVEQGFAEADIIREFTYPFAGAVSVPIQPCGSVAKWDGDQLTFWGMGQGISPVRAALAEGLGVDPSKVRFINKWNGCTFGAARLASERFYVPIAHIARETGRPVKATFNKDQELAQLQIKPETVTKLKVGARRDGRITAIQHEAWVSVGDTPSGGHASGPGQATNQLELYTFNVPNWKSVWSAYQTNANRPGPSRSYYQQETKWSWEIMMDEMAEAVGMDPLRFRLLHVTRPGGRHPYDSFPSVEVLQEGARVFGWDQRNPAPGGNPGRVKRGMGLGMTQHHGGGFGYHDGEEGFARAVERGAQTFSTELELTADGYVTMKNALSDSGSNNGTGLGHMVAEILGFTTRDQIRVIWGDSDLAPFTQEWYAGRTTPLQGMAICRAADKLRQDLLGRAANALNVDVAELRIADGVIASTRDPERKITFAALAQANNGVIRSGGSSVGAGGARGARNKGVGACFVEVEVDTLTGDWRFIRSVYSHDTGLVISPLVAEGDMHGSLVESTQIATDPIPWDREFPGTRHYSVGYLSYRLPTIMEIPRQTQVYIDSLEPRMYFGMKGFSETTIGAVPGALANAIYNACGVRIREHPITREKILAGLRANGVRV